MITGTEPLELVSFFIRWAFSTNIFLLRNYGFTTGFWLVIFGSKDVIRLEFEVLASHGEQIALEFKKATQDEGTMIAVAGAIVAQIAITALSLMDLSNTHWAARALFSFSLVSSIIAVYYACRQHRVMGRCVNASQVKIWIENKATRNVSPGSSNDRDMNDRKPAASSILTVSGPVMLLSAALNTFLAGFGVYLGLTWTKGLDEDADTDDSRNVFLVYAVGLGVCYGIYAVSGLISKGGHGSTDGLVLMMLWEQANRIPALGLRESQAGPNTPEHGNGQGKITPPNNTQVENLIQTLREAAKLREQSAEADRRVADIYRELAQQKISHESRPRTAHHRGQATDEEQGNNEISTSSTG